MFEENICLNSAWLLLLTWLYSDYREIFLHFCRFKSSFLFFFYLRLNTLGKLFSWQHTEIFFLFSSENRIWLLMQIVSSARLPNKRMRNHHLRTWNRVTWVWLSMAQKGEQIFAFSLFHERYKCFEEIIVKTGNYIQQHIDIGICGVNLRPPTSCILAELFFTCWKCTKRKHMEICGVYCPLFNFALC